ncbi:MAG: hypothetical protein GYB66_05875 [Chloroflexi bacterium]|nr:hypothetical protein [Chloroflexota bacterium]
MFETNRRGNLVWGFLMVLAAILLLASGESSAIAPLIVIGVIGLLAVIMTFASQTRDAIRNAGSSLLPARVPTTTAARAARTQATHRPDFDDFYALQDVGLIVDEPRTDGLRLRRASGVSLDDEAVRPYLVVNAPRYGHPAQVLVRFEITDSAGQSQFVYEMDYYMRPGENAILPDYRLPLKGNDRLIRTGKWDLQVWVNGGLLAIHTFNASPSLEERRRQFGIDGEARERLELDADPVPLSLEELLQQQSSHSRSR